MIAIEYNICDNTAVWRCRAIGQSTGVDDITIAIAIAQFLCTTMVDVDVFAAASISSQAVGKLFLQLLECVIGLVMMAR